VTRRRNEILPYLGLEPTVRDVVRARLRDAIASAEADATAARTVDVLDAGCGQRSALFAFRRSVRRIAGVDIHRPPSDVLRRLDAFQMADVCAEGADPFGVDAFDVALSSFTVEHFTDPAVAFRNLRRWLRPGGTLVVATVNRRHPLVGLYLALPPTIQGPLQRATKMSPSHAHPLVGHCNDPRSVRDALEAAGFEDVRVVTVANLARTWSRRLPSWFLGVLGDLATQRHPGRRSTIVADARVPG